MGTEKKATHVVTGIYYPNTGKVELSWEDLITGEYAGLDIEVLESEGEAIARTLMPCVHNLAKVEDQIERSDRLRTEELENTVDDLSLRLNALTGKYNQLRKVSGEVIKTFATKHEEGNWTFCSLADRPYIATKAGISKDQAIGTLIALWKELKEDGK